MTVSIGFDVKPLEAINYFKNKGLKTTFSYADMIAADYVNNFTIAKMMDMDLLQDMYDSLLQAQKKGWTLQQWKDRMIPHLQANGWWGRQAVKDPITGKTIVSELGSSRRLDNIFRTNMQMSYAAGQWQQIKEQERIAPYLMYNAVDDYRTREEHRANDNKIYPVSHPFWFIYYPPNGWSCRCSVVQLSKSDLEDFGYEVSPDTDIEYKDWKNPRTGMIEKIPKGVDPGFNFNAGQARYEQLQKIAKEKAQAIINKAMRESAEEALVKIGMEAKVRGGIMSAPKNIIESDMQPIRTEWGDFPDVIIANPKSTIANHKDYIEAKSGNLQAALNVVDDYLTHDVLKEIKSNLDAVKNPLIVPVHAEELTGRNKLPMAFALMIELNLDVKIDDSIVQSRRAYRTSADGFDRLVKKVSFDGTVINGASYFMIDDAITQGGTLADLKGYIESKGGIVIGSSVLMGKPHSAKLSITKATLGQLRKATGKDLERWWYEQFGYDFSRLTESEARYIAKQIHRSGLDSVRDRIIEARQAQLNSNRP